MYCMHCENLLQKRSGHLFQEVNTAKAGLKEKKFPATGRKPGCSQIQIQKPLRPLNFLLTTGGGREFHFTFARASGSINLHRSSASSSGTCRILYFRGRPWIAGSKTGLSSAFNRK